LIGVGRAADWAAADVAVDLALCWDIAEVAAASTAGPLLPGWLEHEQLVCVSLPNPPLPAGHDHEQLCHCPGTLGKLLMGAFPAEQLEALLNEKGLLLRADGLVELRACQPEITA
jgi:hypothetical protein